MCLEEERNEMHRIMGQEKIVKATIKMVLNPIRSCNLRDIVDGNYTKYAIHKLKYTNIDYYVASRRN